MPNNLDFDSLQDSVLAWAYTRGLLSHSAPRKQIGKLLEEVSELLLADTREEELDALGDILVVYIILCAQMNTSPEECLSLAYTEIKDRKGELVNGVFVKEEEC